MAAAPVRSSVLVGTCGGSGFMRCPGSPRCPVDTVDTVFEGSGSPAGFAGWASWGDSEGEYPDDVRVGEQRGDVEAEWTEQPIRSSSSRVWCSHYEEEDDDDDESADHKAEQSLRLGRGRYLAAVGLGLAVFVAVLLWPWAGTRKQGGSAWPQRSPRQLLESPEFIAHTAAQVQVLGGGAFRPDDEAHIRDSLALGVRRYFDELSMHGANASQALDGVQLTEKKQKHIFRLVGRLGDPRVRDLALKVARAAKAHKGEGDAAVGAYILEALEESRGDMSYLLDRIAPEVTGLRGRAWPSNVSLRLSPERARLIGTYDGWDVGALVEKFRVAPSSRGGAVEAGPLRRLAVEVIDILPPVGAVLGELAEPGIVNSWLLATFEIVGVVLELLGNTGEITPGWWDWSLKSPAIITKSISCALTHIKTKWDLTYCLLVDSTMVLLWIIEACKLEDS